MHLRIPHIECDQDGSCRQEHRPAARKKSKFGKKLPKNYFSIPPSHQLDHASLSCGLPIFLICSTWSYIRCTSAFPHGCFWCEASVDMGSWIQSRTHYTEIFLSWFHSSQLLNPCHSLQLSRFPLRTLLHPVHHLLHFASFAHHLRGVTSPSGGGGIKAPMPWHRLVLI